MKDFLKINRAIDHKCVLQEKKRLEDLQDEGLYPKAYTYPITLQFELTGKCNLRCKHCYNRSGDADRKETTYMTAEKWCELSKQIVADGGVFQCILSGGEPLLLGDDLFDIMDILHDDGTSFVVITNGLLLTKEKVNRFKKYRYFWFQVSIDGYNSQIHDEFRGVNGSWEHAIRGALEVSNAGIPLVIAHSVTPGNIAYLDEMVHLAYRLGANSIILGEILPSGRAIQNKELILNQEQRNYLYGKIEELTSVYRGKICVERSMDLKTQMNHYSTALNGGGIIRPNGDFRLDCMAPFILGNVLDTPLKELWLQKGIHAWESEKVQEFIQSVNENSQKGNIRNHIDYDIKI